MWLITLIIIKLGLGSVPSEGNGTPRDKRKKEFLVHIIQGKVAAGSTFSNSFTRNVSPSSAPTDSGLSFTAGSPLWWGLPGGTVVKKSCQFRRCSFDSWVGKIPLEQKMASHSSIHAWTIPWTEKSGGLQSMRLQRVTEWLRIHVHLCGIQIVLNSVRFITHYASLSTSRMDVSFPIVSVNDLQTP